ncbi:MAG: hypothetical protein J0M12_02985 [Deltaproteobacteria bacterium]|nr:hypothetical protein [Deltaproteobacteria bacterium]
MKNETGFVYVGFLVAAALLTSIGVYRGWHNMKVLRQRSDYQHAKVAAGKAYQTSIIRHTTDVPQGKALHCSESAATSADITIARRVCSRLDTSAGLTNTHALIEGAALARRERFPQFDLNRLLKNSQRCRARRTSMQESSSGFQLSPQSAISKFDCVVSSFISDEIAAFAGNVSITNAISAPLGLSGIAARGYIDISAPLSVHTDLFILAAGDLHIQSIDAPLLPARVTVVSTSGAVVIDTISGPILLRVIAWQGARVPAQAALTAHRNLPPVLSSAFLSLTGIAS